MTSPQDDTPPPVPPVDKPALDKARRGRNIALALGLVMFIILVYGVTLVRMGGHVASRPL
ncbi:MAG: hypothetical protein Q8J89_13250 [Caulobacter sp.]|nr:hypothetical protein [Caulobacter sp.]